LARNEALNTVEPEFLRPQMPECGQAFIRGV
jgi:hypothetical protein